MLTEVQKAYFAGILDGEGSISIDEDSKSKYRKNRSRVSFKITIDNTNQQVLIELGKWLDQEDIHHSIFQYEKARHEKIRHRLSIWRIADSYKFLNEISPYIIIKRPQLNLALEYLESRINKLDVAPRSKILSSREREIVKLLHEANRKGRTYSSTT